ncbi:hypothetical protein OPIT5_29760 [Opitutaceae bacterium TAV5]|nr:hypothetical protein OPIT5_29760 [Opitutaceae bacterium TAV5]
MQTTAEPPVLRRPQRIAFPEAFNHELGLWTLRQAGHTRPVVEHLHVHSGVMGACRLVIAAQLGALHELPVSGILAGIRRLQWLDGSQRHGCFKWFAEEPHPVDTNAAFFVGLNLIVLSAAYRDQLDSGALAELDLMLADLFFWFERESAVAIPYYPNKYLGDLVCAWLLHEQTAAPGHPPATRLIAALEAAARYWTEHHWGWGEHLSDGYTGILFNELSALLLLSRRLPESVREHYTRLLRQLLAIEDAYGNDVRVPAIRTYAFASRPVLHPWRDTIRPWVSQTDSQRMPRNTHFYFGHLFNELGWHALAGPRQPGRERIEIPCHGGTVARAWISPVNHSRLGTMSRYPMMPRSDHAAWGLSWQSMPVAFATRGDGWGFLRWHTREGGVDRFHPARDRQTAYLKNALTDVIVPPVVGLTDSLQDGPDACILRRMPALSRSWDLLADQLVLTGSDFTIVREELGMDASRLLFEAGGEPVTVFFLPLGSGVRPRLWRESGEVVWEAIWTESMLKQQERAACVWMICWGRDVPTLPALRPSGQRGDGGIRMANDDAWQMTWPGAGGSTLVHVDPLAEKPVWKV